MRNIAQCKLNFNRWFKEITDPFTNQTEYIYTQEYWNAKVNKNFSRSPKIFLENE